MNKCREEFYKVFTHEQAKGSDWTAWKTAWNAANKNAMDVCSALGGGDIFGPDENGTEDAYSDAVSDCVEALRKEKS